MADRPLRIRHTVGASPAPGEVALAAAVHVLVWGGGMVVGPASLLAVPLAFLALPLRHAVAFAAIVAFLVLHPPLPEAPWFNRLYLRSAALLKGGSTVWVHDDVLPHIGDGAMVCYHPHGVIPLGFSLNGAVRAKTRQPRTYLPEEVVIDHRVSGVQAPVLFKIPILRQILHMFGCSMPATKEGMFKLFAQRMPFGIVVGGSEEVALHIRGRERLYLRHRAGFLKYALQFGYKIVICYNFGESDLYDNASWMRPLNMALVRRFGFVLPLFWGQWWCPILPRGDVPLNTVWGRVLELPRIEDPTAAQVEEWHKRYMTAVEEVFDAHKAQFGYASRRLEIL